MLTQEQVKHLATLARLKLSPAELETYTRNLDGIVAYVDLIKEIPESAFAGLKAEGLVPEMPLRQAGDARPEVASKDLLACSPKRVIGTEIVVAAVK